MRGKLVARRCLVSGPRVALTQTRALRARRARPQSVAAARAACVSTRLGEVPARTSRARGVKLPPHDGCVYRSSETVERSWERSVSFEPRAGRRQQGGSYSISIFISISTSISISISISISNVKMGNKLVHEL